MPKEGVIADTLQIARLEFRRAKDDLARVFGHRALRHQQAGKQQNWQDAGQQQLDDREAPTVPPEITPIRPNQGGTGDNALQVEVKRRMSAGLLLGAGYVWSHSLTTGNLLSLRDLDGFPAPSNFDIRDAVKLI